MWIVKPARSISKPADGTFLSQRHAAPPHPPPRSARDRTTHLVARGARAVDDGRLDARGAHGVRLARLDAVGTRERGLNRLALRDLARQLGRARNERRDARMRREMARVDSGVGRRHDGDGWRVRVCAWASACVGVLGQARARARARVCSRGSSTKLDGRDGNTFL